jgi:FMN phosphatase YigB (HAD superfamily)
MKKAIIVDLDGTLSDSSWRERWIEGPKKDYDRFSLESQYDEPNPEALKIVQKAIDKDVVPIFLTGRSEKFRDLTKAWLTKQLPAMHEYELIMRPNKDFRPAPTFKKDMYNKKLKDKYEIVVALDDDSDIILMWKSLGITTIQF